MEEAKHHLDGRLHFGHDFVHVVKMRAARANAEHA